MVIFIEISDFSQRKMRKLEFVMLYLPLKLITRHELARNTPGYDYTLRKMSPLISSKIRFGENRL